MKASKQTRSTILWNLEHNVQQAKSKKLRQFAQERLDLYRASIERENKPTFNNPMERFASSIDEWCDGLSASTGSGGLTNERFIEIYNHVNDPKNGWINLGSNQQNGES